MIFNDKPEKRGKWMQMLNDPIFDYKFDMPLDEMRSRAYAQIKKVSEANLVSIFDFQNDPKNIFTAHEMLGLVNGNLATKFTVQFNLFGGSLMALHTERHLPFMKEVSNLKNMGCFCFTELGYGNNAPQMETTAIYDAERQEFDINSPTTMSQKFWITNGACHANYAIVFAQTIVSGKNEGVNSFIVRIRDDQMKPCKGVMIEDMGMKIGLNGIDNARLMFDHVKIPRTAMLNSFNDVNEQGKFISDIPKASARFFKVADRLLSGRLCIAAMSISACKQTIFNAVRYSQQRMGIGRKGLSDMPIMAYQLQQNALLPMLARTIVLNLGYNKAKDLFENPTGKENTQIRSFCSAKTLITWHLEEMATLCRERTGGGSFLLCSAIPEGVLSAHSGMTAEGDNRVLMQKVVKDILADAQKGIHDFPEMTQCPKREIPNKSSITDFETLKNLIFYKEIVEIKTFGKLLQKKIMEEGQAFFDVWMYQVSDEIQSLATAFGHRYMLQGALKYLADCTDPKGKQLLQATIHLHMLSIVRQNFSWYLLNGCVSEQASNNMEAEFDQAVKDYVPHMNTALDALGVPENQDRTGTISRDYVAFNSQPDAENFASAGALFDFRKTGAPRPRL